MLFEKEHKALCRRVCEANPWCLTNGTNGLVSASECSASLTDIHTKTLL